MGALFKDILREVKKSFGRFFAIFAIVMIGVAFFAGVSAASGDMKFSADKYFDDYNLYDLNIVSTIGLDENNLEEIRKIQGVKNIAAGKSVDVLSMVGNSYQVFKIMSIPNDNPGNINQIRIKEGRLPQNSGECVVKYERIRGTDMKIGDKLTFVSGDDSDINSSLKVQEYTIVGFVYTPVYMSYELGNSQIGSGSVSFIAMIGEDDFSLPVYTNCYVDLEDTDRYNFYTSSEYEKSVDDVSERLEELGLSQCRDINEKLEMYGMEPDAKWHILDRDMNYAIVAYENSANQMRDIARIFPVFFFFVAALVCLTTMTRMVDEQRGLIGTYKALGYGRIAISLKYILYAFTASVFGGILGCIAGNLIFPTVIYYCWTIVYQLPDIAFDVHTVTNIIAVASMTGITTLASIFACYKELVSQPAQLMRPKAPKMGKKIFLEHIGFIWKRFSFIRKVTARNIFRYKKRFLMTLIGIAGCTALLIAGFGIKNSIQGLINKQFNEILQYNVAISLEGELSNEAVKDFLDEVKNDSYFEKAMYASQFTGTVIGEDKELDASVYVISAEQEMNPYIHLRRKKGVDCSWDSQGVVITTYAAEKLNLKKGDYLELKVSDKVRKVKVTDIAEMYVGHYVFMKDDYYTEIFGEEPCFNTILGIAKDSTKEAEEKLGSEYMEKDQVDNITFISGNIERFNDMVQSLGLITLVLIISAGALAFVVLYNLTNVNISERIREIATIKVLGFYDNEVSAYVYRENVVITILGAIIGLVLGVFLHHFIMDTIAMEDVIFGYDIYWQSYLYSFGITMIFAVFVNLVMYRKMKKIPMVESLKSVE